MRVSELVPGMVFEMPYSGHEAVFITSGPHPHYAGLMLVVWRINPPGEFPDGLSFDPLSPEQEIGEPIPGTPMAWMASLRAALRGRAPEAVSVRVHEITPDTTALNESVRAAINRFKTGRGGL